MPNYKNMYFDLAGQVANAIDILVQAQQQGEETYVNEETPQPLVLRAEPRKENGENK